MQRRGRADMNCRFAPTDARLTSVARSNIVAPKLVRTALQHCPEEDCSGSS
jgi:hypothetical protein